ncbi:hypothetical protein ABZ897_53405 [Nonomuraea sp. NPDC046802]|uniref:hypothetical protein n=1 Tax=Nonomuraea sp. NPDC046802 TaxID=3154919 RepID=UPI0034001E79
MSEPIKHGRIVVRRFGDVGVLRQADAVSSAPGRGQVRIRVLAAAVGYTDVMARKGEYIFQRGLPDTSSWARWSSRGAPQCWARGLLTAF